MNSESATVLIRLDYITREILRNRLAAQLEPFAQILRTGKPLRVSQMHASEQVRSCYISYPSLSKLYRAVLELSP